MLNRLSLARKIYVSIACIGSLFALSIVYSLYVIQELGAMEDHMVLGEVRKSELAGTIHASSGESLAAFRGVLLSAIHKDPAGMAAAKSAFDDSMGEIGTAQTAFNALVDDPRERALLGTLKSALPEWQAAFADLVRLCDSGQLAQAETLRRERAEPIYKRINDAMEAFLDLESQLLAESHRSNDAVESRVRLWALVFAALGGAMIALIVWLVRGSVAELRVVSEQMGAAAGQLSQTARQVAASSQTAADGASRQAASIEETSASAEEVKTQAERNADSMTQAAQQVAGAVELSVRTGKAVDEMVTSMEAIGQSSDKISKIIQTVDEIAFQTNLLALNAAVEAARAGEAGRGFAVVADEVRTLAQRSATAARETAQLIEESIAAADGGKAGLAQVAEGIQAVTAANRQVKDLVDEVHKASQEQGEGVEQIAQAITQIEQVTSTVAGSAEEGASASKELMEAYSVLSGMLERMDTVVRGSQAG
ncbi:MAG TPA: methyl-accepting chemotaxis protein [Bryobacteraceae bacterium]|nr:methyl-accepting chemotaxis protein [Bryobacteraceae bacterium]